MKRCPTCQRTYTDDIQKFCATDGTPLIPDEPAFDPEATVMSSASRFKEEESSQPPELQPTQYFDQGAGSQPEPNMHQSYPPPQPPPQATPPWPPAPPQQQQQQQPYYPQQGMPGAQSPPQWQGGQPAAPPWVPPGGQQPQGGQWGGGGGFQQPGQYAPYGAQARPSGGSSKAATFALICGIISFVAIAALFIIIGARIRDLRDFIEPLGWLSLGTGVAALILGIVGIVVSKTTSSKIKAGVGMFLGILPLILFLVGMARRF